MDNDEKTRKLLEDIKMLTPEEGAEELLSDQKWYEKLMAERAKKSMKAQPIEEAINRSRLGSSTSGFRDWASGAPTTQEQSRSFYKRLAQEAAKDDVVKDIDIGKYQLQKALDESKMARGASGLKGLTAAEETLARQGALKRLLGKAASGAGKVLGPLSKIAGPVGAIMSLYGDDIAPEGEQFEMPRKPRK